MTWTPVIMWILGGFLLFIGIFTNKKIAITGLVTAVMGLLVALGIMVI